MSGESITLPFLTMVGPIIPPEVEDRYLAWNTANKLWVDLRYHGSTGTGASSLPVILPGYAASVFERQDGTTTELIDSFKRFHNVLLKEAVIQSLFHATGFALFLATMPDKEIELGDRAWWRLLFDREPIERPIGYGTHRCIGFSCQEVLVEPFRKLESIAVKLKMDEDYRNELLTEIQRMRNNQ